MPSKKLERTVARRLDDILENIDLAKEFAA
jgi:hypothetical protein